MNKKTIGEIRVGEFAQGLQKKDTIFNEAGKKVTIKSQYKGFVEAVESFSKTTVKYSHNWLQFNIEKGVFVIMLDKNLDLNILALAEIENEEDFHKQYGLIKLFVSNNTEEIINFLELSTNFFLNQYGNLEIVLENEEASFKLAEDMMNELNSVEAVEEEENNIMNNFMYEDAFKEEIRNMVKEAYEKGIQDAQEELQNKEYLSFKDIGEIYDLSRTTINKWVELGLPLYKIDRTQFIKRSEINNFIDSYQVT